VLEKQAAVFFTQPPGSTPKSLGANTAFVAALSELRGCSGNGELVTEFGKLYAKAAGTWAERGGAPWGRDEITRLRRVAASGGVSGAKRTSLAMRADVIAALVEAAAAYEEKSALSGEATAEVHAQEVPETARDLASEEL
jgi:hypothetical protein